jgi:uncharacterized protein (DUF305 family)
MYQNSRSRNIIISVILCVLVVIITVFLMNQRSQSTQTITSTNSSQTSSKTPENCPIGQSQKAMPGMCMPDTSISMGSMSLSVVDDKSFLEGMIPHHQEAVDSSKEIILTTTDPEIKVFAQNVILDQQTEIDQMKSLYKTWFNLDYTPNSNYMAMMAGTKGKTGKDADKSYITGMVAHHTGAIEMAQKILTLTQKNEIKSLANTIVANQTREIALLNTWTKTKF